MAAPSGESGSNLTFIVAVLGILGTLAGALLTQSMTTRREEKKWQREREQEALRWDRELARENERIALERARERERWDVERERDDQRWERERSERREQWGRENDSRLHLERLSTYGSLLTASQRLAKAANAGHSIYSRTSKGFDESVWKKYEEFSGLLRVLLAELGTLRDKVMLIGSTRVNDLCLDLQLTASVLLMWVPSPWGKSDVEQPKEQIVKIGRIAAKLHSEIRRDIGSEPLDGADKGTPWSPIRRMPDSRGN